MSSSIAFLTIDGNFWFIDRKICNILGYTNSATNSAKTLSNHVDEEYKKVLDRSMLKNGVTNMATNPNHSQDTVSGINSKIIFWKI